MGGWGDLGKADLPETVQYVDSVPHDWLFPRLSAVVHHGGAGTTSTGLRYGRPTIIVPFFADQPFWGEQVHRLGAGPHPIPFTRLSVENLSQAIDQSVSDLDMRRKAAELGGKLQCEDGVGKAVDFIRSIIGT